MKAVERKHEVRAQVWKLLVDEDVVDGDPTSRIPNFRGAESAAARLDSTVWWRSASTIKSNPDKPQAAVRSHALEESKVVYMAVPKLAKAKPFFHVNPVLERHTPEQAAASDIVADAAPMVGLEDMAHLDLVITGCVAVNANGARLGKGAGYADIEYGLLTEAGLIDADTVLATTVHDLQVLDDEIPEEDHDFRLDLIVTPTRIIECPQTRRPHGLDWDRLPSGKIAAIPVLSDLMRHRK